MVAATQTRDVRWMGEEHPSCNETLHGGDVKKSAMRGLNAQRNGEVV
jgi:hypothetical protein